MDVQYDGRGGIRGRSSGKEAVAAHERIMLAAMHNALVMKIGLYGFATVLVIGCAILIVFAPGGRETAVDIVAIALLAIAAGAAGFATFKVKAPGIYASASSAMPASGDRYNVHDDDQPLQISSQGRDRDR